MPDSSRSKRIAKNTAYLYMRMFISMAVLLYTSRVVLNILGVYDYGVYNVVAGIVVMISIITNTMASTTTRFLSVELGHDDAKRFSRVFNTSLYIHLLLAVLVIVLAETLGLWFLNNVLKIPEESKYAAQWVYQFSIFTIVLHIIQSPYTGAIISYERMGAYAYIDLIYVFLKLGIVFLLPIIPINSLILYGGLYALVALVTFMTTVVYCRQKLSGCRLSKYIERSMIKKMLSFNVWSLMSSAAFAGRTQGVNMIMNVFFGVVANTAVGIATQVMSAVENFANNVLAAVTPPIMKSVAQRDSRSVVSMVFSSSKLMTVLMIAIATPLALENRFIINLWLGEVPDYVVPFTQLTLASLYFTPSYRLLEKCVSATGDIKRMSISNSILLLSIIPLSIVVFKLGMPASTAYVITAFVAAFLLTNDLYIASQQIPAIKVSEFIREVIVPCGIVLLFVASIGYIIILIAPVSIFRFITVCFSSVIVCGVAAYFTALNKKEKILVKDLFSKVLVRRRC